MVRQVEASDAERAVSCGSARTVKRLGGVAGDLRDSTSTGRRAGAGADEDPDEDEEARSEAALFGSAPNKRDLAIAVVNCARRPHTMNMTSAAKSKRTSPVGVAGWTAEHGGMLDVQRFAPLRPRLHRAPAMPAPGNRFAKPMYLSRSSVCSD